MTNFGIVGLGTMGANLARNFLAHNTGSIVVHNRTKFATEALAYAVQSTRLIAAYSIENMVSLLQPKRCILIMVAGAGVDPVIDTLLIHLQPGDVIIDGGNSHFELTVERQKRCAAKGVQLLGVGISGGAEGALNGASLMVGGDRSAWDVAQKALTSVAAIANGRPCIEYLGQGGAGHYVKTIHNGIEYGLMQSIADVYDVISHSSPQQVVQQYFRLCNKGDTESFLIEATSEILATTDRDGSLLLPRIADRAEQKGTGQWTVESAIALGIAVPSLQAALQARCLSGAPQREAISEVYGVYPDVLTRGAVAQPPSALEVEFALYAASMICFAQGFDLLGAASEQYKWQLPLSEIASIWQGGCIIRMGMLSDIEAALQEFSASELLTYEPVAKKLATALPSLRSMVVRGVSCGASTLTLHSALNYVQELQRKATAQKLIQAQRDYFGAHGFSRVGNPAKENFDWKKGK
jgi:6-phosphogluconate dehydrogenase